MIALQKLRKMLFISSKNCLFLFSPLFPLVSHCFRGCSKVNLETRDVINCLNKNLMTYFVRCLKNEKRYDIETLFIRNTFMEKAWRKCAPKAHPRPFLNFGK